MSWTEEVQNQLDDALDSKVAEKYAAERRANIRTFVRTNPNYYIAQFDKIGGSSRFTPTLNFARRAARTGLVWSPGTVGLGPCRS